MYAASSSFWVWHPRPPTTSVPWDLLRTFPHVYVKFATHTTLNATCELKNKNDGCPWKLNIVRVVILKHHVCI